MNDQIKIDKKEETDERPLGKIALSLSGGGGRAAGFHMGALAYLDRVDLLKDVTILSSVSGGSHVAAKYALTLKKAPEEEPLPVTFSRFYQEYFGFLMRANLVPRAFEKLSARSKPDSTRKSERQNAVLALADIYDESENFLNGARFDVFWGGREIHLKEIIINTTEFKTGMTFRFHKGASSRRSGNRFVPLPEDYARKARLADIVAASSCIPVGLEPMFFPQDFRWPEDEPKLCGEIEGYIAYHCGSDTQGNRVASVSLMDGGVYDNQGTDSVAIALRPDSRQDLERADMIAARFVRKYDEIPVTAELGLLIISDTPILNDNVYPAPDPARPAAKGRLTLGHLNRAMLTLTVLGLVMVLMNIVSFVTAIDDLGKEISDAAALADATVWSAVKFFWSEITINQAVNFLASGMPVIVGLLMLSIFSRVRSSVRAALLKLPESDAGEGAGSEKAKPKPGTLGWFARRRVAWNRWKSLSGLRVSMLMEMMDLRLTSTWALTSTIFLDRIRSLGYSLLHNRDDIKDRVIKNEIYCIVEQENKGSKHAPSAQMLAVAQRASTMETQLWYDDDAQLKDLVACGQFTMCYNLLEHIDKLRAAGKDSGLASLYKKLEDDWQELRKKPFELIPEMKKPEGGSGDKGSSTVKPKVRAAKA